MEESPVDFNSIVDGNFGDDLMEESTSHMDFYIIQEPLPLPIEEVVPHVHTPSSPTFHHKSHLESQLHMLPIPLDCIVYEDGKDDIIFKFLNNCVFDDEKSLEENKVLTLEEPT